MSQKKHIVKLTQNERDELTRLASAGRVSALSL